MPIRDKVYDKLRSIGLTDSKEDFFNYYDNDENVRKQVYGKLRDAGLTDSEEDFYEYMKPSQTTALQEVPSYKPTQEEVKQHILQNMPDMFKQKNNWVDAPLGDAANASELSDEKFQSRIDVLQKNLQDSEYQKGRNTMDLRRVSSSIDTELESIEEKIAARKKAVRGDTWRPGMPSVRDDRGLAELRGQRACLDGAKELIEDSQNIVQAAEDAKDGTFVGGVLRGVRDKAFDIDTWTMGLSDLVGGMRLNSILEKVEKDEKLTPAEEMLFEASVNNMAINYYYQNDLGKGYMAGQITGESLPFMLEMMINPVSASGNAIAKRLLSGGLKKFAKKKAAQVGARLAGDATAAMGMASTTGMPGVIGDTYRRLNENYNYGVDADGNLYADKKEDAVGMGEAFVRSFATRAIENQSEMIFNAFKPLGGFMKGVQNVLPGGVNKFFDMLSHNKVADAYRRLKKSPVFRNYLVKDLRNATQIGGLGEEYLEEVYNNLANFAIGEMSWEDVTSLDKNIDTLLGLAPTQVMFGLLGLGGAAYMRYQTRRTLEDLQATMNEQQRRELEGLLDMGLDAREVDVRGFIRRVMDRQNYTIEDKRNMIKAAYTVAQQRGIDELTEADVVDKVNAENSLIDSVTDPSTGNYAEVNRLVTNPQTGEREAQPGYVVGWIGEGEKRQPIFVAEGMDNAYENRMVLKPAEWDKESYREMPAEEVKSVNEEMIREQAAQQAEREAKYAPEVLDKQMQLGVPFEDENAIYIPFQATPEGDAWQVEVYNKDENGKPSKDASGVEVITNDQFRDILQAQLETQQAQQAEAAKAEENAQKVVADMPRKTDETGRIFVPTGVQGDEVAYDITDAEGNILESGTTKVSQFSKMQDYVATQEELLNDDGTKEAASGESVGEEVNAGVNDVVNNSEISEAQADQLEQPTLEQVVETLPKDKNGNIDYKAMTPRQQYQYTSLTESPEVALEDLQSDIAAGQEEIAKVQEQLAKARGGQRAELRDKVRQLTAEQAELQSFYDSVVPKQEVIDKENVTIPESYVAESVPEEAQPVVVDADTNKEVSKPKKAKKPRLVNRKKKDSKFTEDELSPANGVELAAEQLAAGNIKITVDSYKKETGYGEEERKKLGPTPFRSVEKGGLTIEQAAEKLVEEDNANHNGHIFDGDTSAARDAVLELFSTAEKWGDVTGYIKNNRLAERKKREEAEYEAYASYLMETLGVTPEELEAMNEAEEQRISSLREVIEELDVIFAEAELERQQLIKEYEQGTNVAGNQGQSELLSEERIGDTRGNQGNESQRGTSEVSSETEYDSEAAQGSASEEVEDKQARIASIAESLVEKLGAFSDETASAYINELYSHFEWESVTEALEDAGMLLDALRANNRSPRLGLGISPFYDELYNIVVAENSKGNSDESVRKEEQRRKPLRERAREWEKKLGAKVNLIESIDDVTNREAKKAIQNGQRVTGWFEESTGEVCFYLPYLESESEVDSTYIHEVVSHKGLRGLLGEKFDAFCDEVWETMSVMDKAKFINYPGVSSVKGETEEETVLKRKRAAADEYIAHLAENIDVTESAWNQFTELIKRFLKAIGLEPKMTNADIANTIKKSYQRLLSGEGGADVAGEGTRFSAKATGYTLSSKTDNDGNRFYEHNGSIDLWDLSTLFQRAGRQVSPIRLTERNMNHILDEHKVELGDSENTVFDFLNGVFSNARILRRARGGAMFAIVESDKTDKAAIIKLYPSKYGDYYNVESAGYYRKSKWKETEDIIARLSEPTQSETASDVSKPQILDNGGKESLNAETAIISTDKDSVSESEMQEKSAKFRVVTDKNLIDKLESEPKIKVYRAMQLVDGKLYPPMSAKVDGKMREPIELGKWEMAEERPDLADDKGYFKLDKGNKSSLKARYNPYIHTSTTPLNDQFSSAQTRPELVTVEVEIPESELTSGYKAEKAKDAVGKLEWKAGVVQGKLSGTRTVILSRYDKPIRIVPDSEVAAEIVKMFDGRDITMPSNVVTPSLRTELEKLGVPFVETDNRGREVGGTRFRATSDRRQEMNRINNTVDQALSLVYGKDIKEVRKERQEQEQKRKEDAAEIYQSVLSGDFNDVTLQKINDYIDDATPLHPYGRRISQRLPQKLERSLHEGARTNAVDALFSRIHEKAVPASRRTSEAGRREIEERKKESLKGWAIATNNWHTDLSDFTDEQIPIGEGTDSKVYASKDGKYVIKTSFGKPDGKRFRPDIDNIPLFNSVFRNSAYEIVGYGEFDGKFARILKQPFVEFAEDSKVSVDERVEYMRTLGFEPINDAKTAFSNGTIIVADLQKSNIVKDASGNISVIDADVKLHTKDVGGSYTYPPVEADLPSNIRFRFIGEKGARNLDKAEEATTRLDNLAVAREMESAEKDAKTIKMATGWERGADGLWRYEVDDNIDFELRRAKKAELKKAYDEANEKYYKLEMRVPVRTPKSATEEEKQRIKDMRKELAKLRKAMNKASDAYYDYSEESATLGDFLGKDNQLFKEYPELAGYDVSFVRDSRKLSQGLKGSFSSELKTIWIDDNRPKGDIKSTLIHEIQHAIQGIEGFAHGGTPAAFASAKYQAEDFKKSFNDFINRYGFEDWEKNLPFEELMKYGKQYKGQFGALHRAFIDHAVEDENVKETLAKELDYVKEAYDRFYQIAGGMDAAYKFKDATEWYRSLSGEVESRNVQQRMGMTDEQRRNTLAESTEDVAREDQIFLKESVMEGQTMFRVVGEPTVDYVSQADDVVEVPRNMEFFTMKNVANKLYQNSGRFMRELYKYGTLGRVLKGEYGEIDQIKAKNEYDRAKPILEEYLNELVWMKHHATEAAQVVINDVISDVEYAMQYYKDLALGKDVWRTHVSPRFRISDHGKRVKAEVDKFAKTYNSKEFVVVDTQMTEDELREVFPEVTLEEVKDAVGKGYMGGYSSETDKIYIFADNQPLNELEDTMFHENLHELLDRHPEFIDEFYVNASDKLPNLKSKLEKLGYEKSEIPEEMFVRVATSGIVRGDLYHVRHYLPEDMADKYVELLNDFGYEQRTEFNSRVLGISGQKTGGTSGTERKTGKGIQNLDKREDRELQEAARRERKERLTEFFGRVADMGLQGVLGNMEYDRMMMDVYSVLPEDARKEIVDDTFKHYGFDFVPAVSDYIGAKADGNLWDKIVSIVREALRKVGFDLDLNANEVKYLAWRSKKPLDRNNLLDVAEDIDMKYRLKVGEYDGSPSPDGGGTKFRVLDEVNDRFNKQLDEYINEGVKANTIFSLGNPQGAMKHFLPNLPIVMRPRIINKSSHTKHNVEPESLRNLPQMISEPIFVFKRSDNALGVLTEIKDRDGKNVCVAIEMNKTIQNGGEILEVNDIRSIHGRETANLILPIVHNNTLVYADKKKGLAWLSSASYNYQQEIDKKDLDSATKIVESFENPKVGEGNVRFKVVYHGSGASFDRFDHRYMGTGEGNQSFGWGTYVTDVEGIGRVYAGLKADNSPIGTVTKKWLDENPDYETFVTKGEGARRKRNVEGAREWLEEMKADGKPAEIIAAYEKDLADAEKAISEEGYEETRKNMVDSLNRNLYKVEIPDESEGRYIDYTQRMSKQGDAHKIIADGLRADGWEHQDLDGRDVFTKDGERIVLNPNQTGADLYEELSDAFGAEKDASEFLSKLGFTGLVYPANYFNGGTADNAKNYVIFNEKDLEIKEHTRFRVLDNVNEKFNKQLDDFKNKTHKGLLSLGAPLDVLRASGVNVDEITLSPTVLHQHLKKHNLTTDDLKGLASAIQEPILVYKHGKNHPNLVVVTEMDVRGGKLSVALELDSDGNVIEISNVKSVHSKEAITELQRLSDFSEDELKDNLRWVEKEKVSDWLLRLPYEDERTIDNQKLNSIANIINSFENPKVGEGKSEGNSRFRVANKLQVRDEYEATIKKSGYQTREAVQDAMLSLRKFQELIEKASGKKIRDFENAWMHENRLSSVVQAEIHEMERKFYKPMMEAVKKLMKAANLEQEQVADYLMLKHGIERNREMAVRRALTNDKGEMDRTQLEQWYQEKEAIRNDASLDTWRKKQEAMDNLALMYGADMSRDYSGLTSMFDTDDIEECTNRAYDEVEALEEAHQAETEALGKAIKAMTQNTLDQSFGSGLMDRKVYDELSKDMYDYYIPLRGFEETTSDEVYAYLDQDRGAFNAPLVRAKGRSSKSDNPLAYLKSIAESGIMQGERNKMKQSFLNLVINHPSDLVSVREGVWVIYNPATGEWEAASAPAIPNNATPSDVEAAMEAWEQQMEQAAQNDPNIKKVSESADVPYRVLGNRMNQHQVIVKRLGKSYTLTINGNPRLAMALNGLTNPNNRSNDGKVLAYIGNKVDALNRTLSAWYTTRNPDFVASNFMRDTFYTNTIVRAKEGNAYANKFHKNYAKALPRMLSLFAKYENGTLNPTNQMEAAFLDFMMNGGETGYSNLKDLEHIKKQIAKELKGNRFEKMEAIAEKLDILNRAVENTARFAAFLTSREEGRSIAKSVFDAKEISVNFNKKGAGGTFFGMTGQTKFGNLAAMVGAGGRGLYVFFNAAIQGTTNLLHVMKVNPVGTSAGLAAMFLMGAVVPFLFGGDDEKDYYDLPEHVRRNHLIIPGGGDAWVSIPLPIEYRIMYGMGELLTSWRTGHERGSNIGRKMLNLTGQALPLNFLEEGMDAFVPSAISPLWQVYNNRSWTGLPIYKDTDFNKDDPEYTKAYSNVDRGLLKFTKAVYEWTFDEENQEEGIDLNPAVIETLAKGYFGGLATQLSNLMKVGGMVAGEQEFDWRNIPIGNRIFKSGDKRTKEKRVQNEYFENIDKLDFMQARERRLKKTMNGASVPEMDKFEAQKDLETMRGSAIYQKYQQFKIYKKQADKLYKYMKANGATEALEKRMMEAQEAANKAVR